MLRRACLALTATLLAAIGACSPQPDVDLSTCPGSYDKDHVGADGVYDPCHETDPRCPGECVPMAPAGWNPPGLLWIGPIADMPTTCPARAASRGWQGYADLVAPVECPACTCAPPTGSCELPKKIYTRASPCGGSGWVTPFDGPAGWDGTCTDANGIPQGKDCAGAPCVQSLVVEPLTVVENGCAPAAGPPPAPAAAPFWTTAALYCNGTIHDPQAGCADSGSVCVPSKEPPPPEFRQCVYKQGDNDCPTYSPYQEKHVFYESYEDDRKCSDCQCGQPTGSLCTGLLSIFTGNVCTQAFFKDHMIASTGAICIDIQPQGIPLLSKSISDVTYNPGTCEASGGEPIDFAKPVEPSTFCCLPKSP